MKAYPNHPAGLPCPALLHVTALFLLGWLAGPGPAAAQTGGFTVNIASRDAVRTFFNTTYAASEGVPIDSTANVASCVPGTSSQAFRDAVLRRVNWYRAMAGVPASVTFHATTNNAAQRAALIMSANNSGEHFPTADWNCWSSAGSNGASHGNISMGAIGPDAINGYMRDQGPYNYHVGHRRNMLHPSTRVMGTGDIPTQPGHFGANVLYVLGETIWEPRPATRTAYVSWPPPGFVPYQVVFSRWSFEYPNADFSAATVTMRSNNVSIPVSVAPLNDGPYGGIPTPGGRAIVWIPAGLPSDGRTPWPRPGADTVYSVSVNNVRIGGTPQDFNYTVTIFDPSVGAGAATSVTTLAAETNNGTARLIGSANPSGSATGGFFEWGTTTSFGHKTPLISLGNGANPVGFTNLLSGLTPGQVYHYRAAGSNAAGIVYGATKTFNPATPASVTTVAASQTSASGTPAVLLNGLANPNGTPAVGWFRFGRTTAYTAGKTTAKVLNNGTAETPFTHRFVDGQLLGDGTTMRIGELYHYRAFASNAAGTVSNVDMTFMITPSAPPTVTTLAPTSITGTSVQLNGSANPSGSATTAYFQWGTTTSYGLVTPVVNLGSASSVQPFSSSISSLTPGQTYHYRAVANSAAGTAYGADMTFIAPALPSTTTMAAQAITPGGSSAQLLGSANPNGSTTIGFFQWGTTTSYGHTTPAMTLGNGSSPFIFNQLLSNLTPGQTYHYRAMASNAAGLTNGTDMTFVIPTSAISITLSAAPALGGTATGTGNSQLYTAVARPNNGYTFVNWTEGGTPVSSQASYSFTATASRTLVANFASLANNAPPGAFSFVPLPVAGRSGENRGAAAAWGDYDKDGRLDFVVLDSGRTELMRNTTSGFTDMTTLFAPNLPQALGGSVAWGDYDNDTNLDLFVSAVDTASRSTSQLWYGTGSGFNPVTIAGLPQLGEGSSVAWADYDNNGTLDLLVTGREGSAYRSQLWRDAGGLFTRVPIPGLPEVQRGAVAWGDYNNDGRLDFFIAGQDANGYVSQLWRNTGSGFSLVPIPGLPPVADGSVAWGDYDNDGRLDLFITGEGTAGYASQLWRNTGSGFSLVPIAGLPGVSLSAMAWGDYDNDGRLDFLLTGTTNGQESGARSQLWRNTAGGFINVSSQVIPYLPAVHRAAVAWGDYDKDGRLDILLTSAKEPSTGRRFPQLWRNNQPLGNTPPTAPTGLAVTRHGQFSATLRWNPASDVQTPASGLSYNLVLDRFRNVASPHADVATGFRRIVRLGTVLPGTGGTLSYTFTNLPPATDFTWSVQAVDSAFSGGPFAPAQTFNVNGAPPITCPADLVTNVAGVATSLAVTWPAPVAVDGTAFPTNPPVVACVPASGSIFPLGASTVTCVSSNFWGQDACQFQVIVCPATLPSTFTVTSAADSGPGSLRDAMGCIAPGGVITFAPALNNQTIQLTSGSLIVNKSVTILGPDAGGLTLRGNGISKVIRVTSNSPPNQVTLARLNITGEPILYSPEGGGGGIWNQQATLVVSNCTISGNISGRSAIGSAGGGIRNEGGNVTLVQSTLSGNFASGAGSMSGSGSSGGAIYSSGGSILIRHCTLSSNIVNRLAFPGAGSGIHLDAGTLTIGHTLLSQGSVVVPDGSLISQGFNMATFAASWATFVPNLFLGPLARNGGPTLTHALLPGSPAINAGIPTPPYVYDQRGQGFPRLVGNGIDIGAYEVQAAPIAAGQSAAAVAAPEFQALFPEKPPGVAWGAVAWGDYDNDGRLDLLLTGAATNDVIVAQLWRNTGSQGFQKVPIPGLRGVAASAVAWGDFDNDGRLDFVLTGCDSSRVPRSELWRNTGAGFSNVTSQLAAELPGIDSGSVAWADFNNDGRLDLFLTGLDEDFFPVSQLWQNTAGGFSNVTRQIAESLPDLANSAVAWADYDQDGRMDFLITGSSDSLLSGATSQLWRNIGSEFIPIPIHGLPGAYQGSVAWADFDNDGRLDFLLTGESEGGFVSQLWRNTSSGFSNVTSQLAPGLPGTAVGSAAWGDYDNDGRTDLLLTGDSTLGSRIAQLWRNTGAGFVEETNIALAPVRAGSVAWADYDNNGRLDLLVTGQDTNGVLLSEFPWNIQAAGNLPPTAPTGLSAHLSGNKLTVSWLPATDDHGLPGGLTYNVVLSGSPDAVNLASPMAGLTDGFRRVARLGGAGLRTSWTFTDLPPAAAYFWSVQAVDAAYAGGAFAPMQGVLNATLTGLSFAPGQATVSFTGVSGRLYVVEYSDDLIAWRLAGTATESPAGSGNFIFQDDNAPGGQRFYQIGYYPPPGGL